MSDNQSAKPTDPTVFENYFLNASVPKNERDHWAGGEIGRLRQALDSIVAHADTIGFLHVRDTDEVLVKRGPTPLLCFLWALRHAQFVRRKLAP